MHVQEAFAEAAARSATEYLADRGFRVLDRHWQHDGEIVSILAVERHTFVAVDLRVCAGIRHGRPLHDIGAMRKRTMRRLAAHWLTEHGMRFDQIRIDVVGLLQDGAGGFTVEHIRAVG